MNTSKRFVGEPVELSRDCELGQEGDRAVVTVLDDRYMTLHFPDRDPDCRDVHTGADYKYLRAYGGKVDLKDPITVISMDARARLNKWGKYAAKNMPQAAARRELRDLVATYLEGSDDAPRAAELLDALEPLPSMLSDTFWEKAKEALTKEALTKAASEVQKDETASARWKREERERSMFGCTAAAIDEVLANKEPRDIAMYAMGTLSNAQELICRDGDEPFAWSVRRADANTIRQLMNIAKYAIDKAVPRTPARLDAVWAAVYVRVLSATPPSYPADDHNIHGQAAVLGDPTVDRVKIATKAADNAVLRLVEVLANAEESP